MLPAISQDFGHTVVPSHQPLIDKGLICPLMVSPLEDHVGRSLSPSTACPPFPASAVIHPTVSSSLSPPADRLSPIVQQPNFVGLTGDWHADAQAVTDHMLHAPVPRYSGVPDASSLDASIVSPSNRSRKLTQSLRRTRRSKSHPYIDPTGKATPRPPSRMRLSAPPIKIRAKKSTQSKPAHTKPALSKPALPKPTLPVANPALPIVNPALPIANPALSKPPLACLFCRGRKIACGAPPAGSEKQICQ
jgi:hypothetical protein